MSGKARVYIKGAARAGLTLIAASLVTVACADAQSKKETIQDGTVSVVFRIEVPTVPPDPEVWISGNLPEIGQWNGAGVRGRQVAPNVFEIVQRFPRGASLEFKVTRGSWETVEKGLKGEEIANRRFVAATSETVDVVVANWRDFGPQTEGRGGASTLTGHWRLHEDFESESIPPRDVLVLLPPDYEESERQYPVLYMHDGQNLFDASTSFLGIEWEVDEALNRLVASGNIEPVIVVGIYNSGTRRLHEYTPVADSQRGGGGAEAYGRFLVEELKPFIDQEYRTRPGRDFTGVGGSSLGGLVSLYLGLEYPEVFSRWAVVSPSVHWADGEILSRLDETGYVDSRIWVDMGTAEGPSAITHARRLRDQLEDEGWELGANLRYVEDEGAPHNEAAWARRMPAILEFLYPAK